MFTAIDGDLARRDFALPGLATLLDPIAIACAVGGQIGAAVDELELAYLRYKPGTNCIAGYRSQSSQGPVHLYAKAYGADAALKLAKARLDCPGTGDQSPTRAILPEIGVVVFRFPDDAKLSVLSRLSDPAARARLLERVFDHDAVDGNAGFETLAYKPERRYVARFAPESSDGGFVVKFYGRDRRRAARKALAALESRGRLRLPKRRGGSRLHSALALEWMSGPTLRESIDTKNHTDMSEVGAAIAELHAQRNVKLAVRAQSDRLADLPKLADTLGLICPSLSDDAERVAEQVMLKLDSKATAATAIHGDLYDKQIVLNGDQIGLVDLDDATRGDIREDLGLFIAHWERDRLMGRSLEKLNDMCGSLLEGYQVASGNSVTGLAPFVAEGLFRLAHHPFRLHGPMWPEQTKAILERARERLAGSASIP